MRRHHPAGDEAAGSSLDDSSMLCQLRVGVASLTMALQGPHPPPSESEAQGTAQQSVFKQDLSLRGDPDTG